MANKGEKTWIPIDKYGWPIELILGRPITNMIRLILDINLRQTWRFRHMGNIHKIVGYAADCQQGGRDGE